MYEFEKVIERRNAVINNIQKSFDVDVEKARSGVYADTAENRKLNRVGQEYGKKGENKSQKESRGVVAMKDYLSTFNAKYKDLTKVEVSRTPKGNWDVRYDGHRLGILNGNQVPESTAKKMGWLRD